jgi:integrase
LEWRNVDLGAQVIRIEKTKNREPRTFPYSGLAPFVALMERQRKRTEAVEQARGIIVPRVFHRDGVPIREFRGAWAAACVGAGLGREVRTPDRKDAKGNVRAGRLLRREITRTPHDFRRTAAMRLSRAGVPEAVIMKLCGWKTRSVFDRYRIVPEQDLVDGLARLAGHTPPGAPRKVVRMRRR